MTNCSLMNFNPRRLILAPVVGLFSRALLSSSSYNFFEIYLRRFLLLGLTKECSSQRAHLGVASSANTTMTQKSCRKSVLY